MKVPRNEKKCRGKHRAKKLNGINHISLNIISRVYTIFKILGNIGRGGQGLVTFKFSWIFLLFLISLRFSLKKKKKKNCLKTFRK